MELCNMTNKIGDENVPQGRREEAKQIEQEKRQKRRGTTKSAYISAPQYFLTANILQNCSAELSLLCFVSYNISQRPHNPERKL